MSYPPAGGSAAADGIDPMPDTSRSRPRALVVESDQVTAAFVHVQLEELGFDVETVTTGVQAVIAARHRVPSLIVTALQLRDAHGPRLLAWLRSNPELKDVPVIAIHAVSEDAMSMERDSFAGFLRKPLTAANVRQVVTAVFPVSR